MLINSWLDTPRRSKGYWDIGQRAQNYPIDCLFYTPDYKYKVPKGPTDLIICEPELKNVSGTLILQTLDPNVFNPSK